MSKIILVSNNRKERFFKASCSYYVKKEDNIEYLKYANNSIENWAGYAGQLTPIRSWVQCVMRDREMGQV